MSDRSTGAISVAVIGAGAFGRNHARVYDQLAKEGQPVRLVGVVDTDPARADSLAAEFKCRAFGSVEELLGTRIEIHAASIAVPTVQHAAVARPLEVDVVLDLMVHALAAVLAFVKSPVKEIRAAGLPILSNKIDIANARIEFESGCVANFTASRVSTERVRKLRFFQPRQYISIDYGRQDVLVFTVGESGGAPSANPDIKMSKPQIALEEPLHAELREFLDAVRNRRQPAVTLEDGRRALAVALEVLGQIEAHASKLNLSTLTNS